MTSDLDLEAIKAHCDVIHPNCSPDDCVVKALVAEVERLREDKTKLTPVLVAASLIVSAWHSGRGASMSEVSMLIETVYAAEGRRDPSTPLHPQEQSDE